MNLGSQLSKMFGDHKSVKITAPENTYGDIQNTKHYRSSTTNSYNRCIYELADVFPLQTIELAIEAISKHDKNNFTEFVDLGYINKFDENTGKPYIAGKYILRIIGKYEFKYLAHCKTVEMWVDRVFIPVQ